jgi:hypothetical protein
MLLPLFNPRALLIRARPRLCFDKRMLGIAGAVMQIDRDVAAVNPAEFLKPLPPCCNPEGLHGIVLREQEQGAALLPRNSAAVMWVASIDRKRVAVVSPRSLRARIAASNPL